LKKKAYLISAVRTPVTPIGGEQKNIAVHKMAAALLNETLGRVNIPKSAVDAVLISNAMGGGGNSARLCVLEASFSNKLLGTSIDRQCVGGLDAIIQAVKQIQYGEANIVLAGGVESFSLRPERHFPTKWNTKAIPLERPPFFPTDDPTLPLGDFMSPLKKEYAISTRDEFEWVKNSHQKALAHKALLDEEVFHVANTKAIDPFAREITWEMFQKSAAKFGDPHPCNTAPKADGAAFVAVVSEEIVKAYDLQEYVEILDGFTIGGAPENFPILPATAMKQILEKNTLNWNNISQLELMEAYAVQAILCASLSGAPHNIINPHGGAISRGHPIGASGAVLAVHLFHSLKNTNKIGIASIAGAGGLASTLLLKGN